MKQWQLQDAKAKLSEVVKQAITHGPQMITLHGEPAVVILSQKEFNNLKAPKQSLIEFMQKSPLKGVKLDLTRDKSTSRDTPL